MNPSLLPAYFQGPIGVRGVGSGDCSFLDSDLFGIFSKGGFVARSNLWVLWVMNLLFAGSYEK